MKSQFYYANNHTHTGQATTANIQLSTDMEYKMVGIH